MVAKATTAEAHPPAEATQATTVAPKKGSEEAVPANVVSGSKKATTSAAGGGSTAATPTADTKTTAKWNPVPVKVTYSFLGNFI